MLLRVRMKKVEDKLNTTKLEPCDEPAPLKDHYINTEFLTSLPFGTEELILHLSDEPLPEGEVAIAFPSLPFNRSTKNLTRFEIQNDRGRRLRSSLENPVTQAFVYNDELGAEFIKEKRPLYSGISPVPEAVVEEQQATVDATDLTDEVAGADAVAAFDAFLKASVRVQRGGRITSRQIWEVWAARWGADSKERVIAGVRFIDVSRRFRATFGATAAKDPTRIDGELQRYFSGYAI